MNEVKGQKILRDSYLIVENPTNFVQKQFQFLKSKSIKISNYEIFREFKSGFIVKL